MDLFVSYTNPYLSSSILHHIRLNNDMMLLIIIIIYIINLFINVLEVRVILFQPRHSTLSWILLFLSSANSSDLLAFFNLALGLAISQFVRCMRKLSVKILFNLWHLERRKMFVFIKIQRVISFLSIFNQVYFQVGMAIMAVISRSLCCEIFQNFIWSFLANFWFQNIFLLAYDWWCEIVGHIVF